MVIKFPSNDERKEIRNEVFEQAEALLDTVDEQAYAREMQRRLGIPVDGDNALKQHADKAHHERMVEVWDLLLSAPSCDDEKK